MENKELILGEYEEQIIAKYNLTQDDIEATECVANTRRPLVLFRGKPITPEQAMHLITLLEPLFADEKLVTSRPCFDLRKQRGLLKNIFYRPGYDWLDTWIHIDGTIGGNIISLDKYPTLIEYIEFYEDLCELRFLDMVIAYTSINEGTCNLCDALDKYESIAPEEVDCNCLDCKPYIEKIKHCEEIRFDKPLNFEERYYANWEYSHVRSDVHHYVEVVLWIHDGKTEILVGKKAKDKFIEYNKLYSSPEYEYMFTSEIHKYDKTCVCNKKYVEDCFEYMGKPRTLVDEYIEKSFISPFNDKAEVVTKAWMIEQYEKYIKSTQVKQLE